MADGKYSPDSPDSSDSTAVNTVKQIIEVGTYIFFILFAAFLLWWAFHPRGENKKYYHAPTSYIPNSTYLNQTTNDNTLK